MSRLAGYVADNALCVEVGPALFFPEASASADAGRAKSICNRCLVKTECLTVAIAYGPSLEGVWGGTTTEDRYKLRKLKKAA